jgi:hypothetical protein
VARIWLAAVGLVLGGFLALAPVASALTLGESTDPSTTSSIAEVESCTANLFYTQLATDAAYSYTVPAGGGMITSWSTNTQGATAGAPITLLVLQPGSSSSYTVVGLDSVTLPNPLPTGNVATFNLTSPIAAAAGDVLGLYAPAGGANCFFESGPIPTAEEAVLGSAPTAPAVGSSYTATSPAPNTLIDVSANLVQSQDVEVSGAATPSSISAGGAAAYAFSVGNNGPDSLPTTFTDTIPSGLKILAAAAGSGSCTTAGQAVTCTITGLAAGTTTPVLIIVSAASAGGDTDTATVSSAFPDANPANNSATATLTVTTPPVPTPASCKVIKLAGAPLAVAKAALPALNCTVGKTTKKASKSVRKGDVISTAPAAGKTLAAGTKVNIVVSSGPLPKKKKKQKKKK